MATFKRVFALFVAIVVLAITAQAAKGPVITNKGNDGTYSQGMTPPWKFCCSSFVLHVRLVLASLL